MLWSLGGRIACNRGAVVDFQVIQGMRCSWSGKAALCYSKEKVGPKFRRRLSSTGEESPHYYYHHPQKVTTINAGLDKMASGQDTALRKQQGIYL
jgi:hypothetical protein